MIVKQFRYFTDNLGYLLYSGNKGVVIDAGGVDAILDFCRENRIEITAITNTHFHHDHISGNELLLEKTQADFLDCRQIRSDQTMPVGDSVLTVFPTPGHTLDSVSFMADDFLITGDTLFNGTVGNCFSGDLLAFYHSLKRLISLPEKTKVYGGHDYVMESMKYAGIIEPDNPYIDTYIQNYSPALIVSTLEDELNVNPYVRFNAPAMIENLHKRKIDANGEFERFKAIMEIY